MSVNSIELLSRSQRRLVEIRVDVLVYEEWFTIRLDGKEMSFWGRYEEVNYFGRLGLPEPEPDVVGIMGRIGQPQGSMIDDIRRLKAERRA